MRTAAQDSGPPRWPALTGDHEVGYARRAMPPTADRPAIPREYGSSTSSEGLLEWELIERRLTDARMYWIATSGPSGRPRVRPVDGIYLDGTIWVGGSPETRWIRDLKANAQVSVHLDGPDVVIVEARRSSSTASRARQRSGWRRHPTTNTPSTR